MGNSFIKTLLTLGVFIDFSKTFGNIDHDILIRKLKNYRIRENNLKRFESYLNSRKPFISFDSKNTSFNNIKCGVLKGSVLGALLFLIYVNDLNRASDTLDLIMFADDTNLFYSHKDVKTLFIQ